MMVLGAVIGILGGGFLLGSLLLFNVLNCIEEEFGK